MTEQQPWKCPDCGAWVAWWVRDHRCRPAPAVPVGVQPEPAEGVDEKFVRESFDRFAAAHAPAVPVVHPEPGDRAEEREEAECTWRYPDQCVVHGPAVRRATVRAERRPLPTPTNDREARWFSMVIDRYDPLAAMALADAEVAAAVAAVRAELCERCKHPRSYHPNGGCEADLCSCWEYES